MRKIALALSLLLSATTLAGCWNYVSLSDITIVSACAIDLDETTGQYLVTFETVDVTGAKEAGPQSKIVQAEGRTLFDAARNAKMRLQNKLYFANMEVLMLSRDIAANMDLEGLLDWFLADAEIRETLCVAVSAEQYARDIFMGEEKKSGVSAFILHDIITKDNQITSSTSRNMLYQIYGILKTEGKTLTLPLVHKSFSGDEKVNELYGTAVYKGQRMVGTLSPEESKYFLFAMNEVKGGLITLPLENEEHYDISLEIHENHTKTSCDTSTGQVIIKIKTDTEVYLGESHKNIDMTDKTQIKALEVAAGQVVQQNIEKLVQRIQSEYNSDIFGFGALIHQKNQTLWKQLEPYWDSLFPNLKVEVESKVTIVNTSFTKLEGK